MLICGIDPGMTGAWGMIDIRGKYWSCGDMHNDEQGGCNALKEGAMLICHAEKCDLS